MLNILGQKKMKLFNKLKLLLKVMKSYLYLTSNNSFFLRKEENQYIGLLQINKSSCNLKKDVLEIIQKLDSEPIETICVIEQNGYNNFLSLLVSHLYHIIKNSVMSVKPSYELCLPTSEMTKNPSNLPVVFSESLCWRHEKNICILPGWEFYGLDWILYRWESALGFYDYNCYLPTPSYPCDIYNVPVLPSFILQTIEKWVSAHSLKELKIEYYGLYCFYKDDFGKKLLDFFYQENEKSSSKTQLYKKLYDIYHSTEISHPFRPFIFYRNNVITTTKKFRLASFIAIFLSLDGMYICKNFYKNHESDILYSFQKSILRNFGWSNKQELSKEITKAFDLLQKGKENFPTWICREYLEPFSENNFLLSLHSQWNYMDRNLYLCEPHAIRYSDGQYVLGSSITNLYSSKEIANFAKPPNVNRK